MCTVTVRLHPDSQFLEKDVEAAIRSVLDDADPGWSVSVLTEETSLNWNVGAQPGDEQPFDGVLAEGQHSAEAVRDLISGWYEQYQEWRRDSE